MKYECKENDCVLELSEDKEEIWVSTGGNSTKTVIGMKDLSGALSKFGFQNKKPTIFKSDAKAIVDMLFDSKVFREEITRDDMNATEDYLAESMRMRFESVLRGEELKRRIDEKGKSCKK